MEQTLPANPPIEQPDQVRMFGLDVENRSSQEIINWIYKRVTTRNKTRVHFVNAHCLNTVSRDLEYYRALQRTDRILPDGSGVRLAMRMQGIEMVENLNGTDLFPPLCEMAAAKGLSIFLLGAQDGIAEQVADNIIRRIPNLQVAGTHSGFFAEEETDRVIETINRSGADILLVAMGVPRQEIWLDRHFDKLQTTVNMGVGGLFDFYSKRISRAPLFLRKAGLEWTWRLLQEPGRMWRRYLIGNPEFVLRALADAHGRQRGRRLLPVNGLGSTLRRLKHWISRLAAPATKRLLDIVVAGSALVSLAPVMILTALAIRLESPGPVFFSQTRVGLRGEQFHFWKFRSMYRDADKQKTELLQQNEMDGGVLFKMRHDPRVTRVGRFIRRYSIDELPQLWNVLHGDMSLVGPRPALPKEVAQYSLSDRHRLDAAPGITCIWQVSGRSDIPFQQQVQMDVQYIHQSSVTKDMQLLLKTVPAVLSGRGAY